MSEGKSADRRARRSRRQLKEALFALILEKGYDAVTIEEITDRADLGRTTFYLHYRDKEDLLLESLDSIAEELIARLPAQDAGQVPPPGPDRPREIPGAVVQEAILIVFQHAAENAALYRIILRGTGATSTRERLQAIISHQAVFMMKDRLASGELRPQVPVEVFASYFAGSLLGLITWWLESESPYSPEEMAEMFFKLFFLGGRRVLGIE